MPIRNVKFGGDVQVWHPDLVNLYGCEIGAGTKIGPFVEIQKGVVIGENCVISSHSFLCEGVTLGNGVFIGHGVMFCNEKRPQANRSVPWESESCGSVRVSSGASIGSGSVILPDVMVKRGALVGAGSVVTKDVEAFTVVYGNPARTKEEWEKRDENIQGRHRCGCGETIPPSVSPLEP